MGLFDFFKTGSQESKIKRSSSNLSTLFTLSNSISHGNENNAILRNALKLQSLILMNKDIFDLPETKELYDSMEQSYKSLIKAIPLTTNANERYALVKATFFVLSRYREVSPGNGNVCEDKIRLLSKYKVEILRLFEDINRKAGMPSDADLAYEMMLYYLLDDNSFMLDNNDDLKQMHAQFANKFSVRSANALNLGKVSERRYYALMNQTNA